MTVPRRLRSPLGLSRIQVQPHRRCTWTDRYVRSAGWPSALPTWLLATPGRVLRPTRFLEELLYRIQLRHIGWLYHLGPVQGLQFLSRVTCSAVLPLAINAGAAAPTATGWNDSCQVELVPIRRPCLVPAHYTFSRAKQARTNQQVGSLSDTGCHLLLVSPSRSASAASVQKSRVLKVR